MNHMKRMLALILALVMIVGVLPMSVLAEGYGTSDPVDFTNTGEDNTHYLFFATDRHANTSIIGNIINNMEKTIGENKLEYLGLGGDMVGSGNSHPPYNSSTVLGEVTGATSSLNATNVDIVAGIHDMAVTDDSGIVLPYEGGCGLLYEGEDYYVYGVEEYCISEDSDSSNWSAQAQAFVDWANGSKIDKSKVIIVLSHYPLHAQRNDNHGAYYWHQALNKVATGSASDDSTVERNIVFFHGHNHTTDSKEYVYNVGDSMTIQNGSSTTSDTIYYTYATAGYLNQNSKATLVTITNTTITLTKYSTSGSGTSMTTVDRRTPKTLAVTGKIEYTVGDPDNDTIQEPTEVKVTYTDGTSGTTSDYKLTQVTDANGKEVTLTNNQFTTAGTYNLIYTCTIGTYQAKATLKVTVNPAEEEEEETEEKEVSYILAEGTTAYTVGDTLTFNVVVTYTDGSSVTVSQADCEVKMSCTAHASCADVATAMKTVACENGDYHNVTVTYGGKDTEYKFTVGAAENLTGEAEGVVVRVSSGVVISVSTAVSANGYVAGKMEELGVTSYSAYDITPEEALKAGNLAGVYLPLPDGVLNPVVYYVSDDGQTVTKMDAVVVDGKAFFVTDHFSTYVVGAGAVIGTTATVPGTTVTTKVATPVTVYKKVTTPESGKQYLIVNSANGTGYGLDGDTTGYATSVFTGGDDYYSSWDDATKTGTAFAAGSDVYLTAEGAYLWTAGSDSFSIGYDSDSSSGTMATNYTYTLNPGGGTTGTWGLSDNRLSISLVTRDPWFGSSTNTTFYISNSGSSWSMGSSSGTDVYFYEPVTVYQVADTTTGTQEATYGIDITLNGSAASTMNANNVVKGDTVELSTAFTSTVSGQQPSGGAYTWTTTTNNGVASVDANGKVTFTGKAGTEMVKVSYTWTVNNVEYTISNTLEITATAKTYSMNIVETDATVKISANLTLTLEAKDSEGNAVTPENVNWTSSNTAAATVANGVVTGVVAGTTVITAEWTDPAGVKHTDTVNITVVDALYTLDLHTQTTDEDGNPVVGDEITAPVVRKGVKNGDTYSVWAVIKADGEDIGDVADNMIVWTSSDPSVATVDPATGVITFTGKDGTVDITATYQGSNKPSDTITISATSSQYTVPGDGTNDFPDYPNEGAVRFDKTATAVGNFSETGITQIELSMTGVPYTTGSEMDVVIMLDQSTSMDDDRIAATVAATKAFIKSIVINEDGTYNSNRIYVGYFNGSKTYDISDSANIGGDLATIDSKDELDALFADIDDEFDGSPSTSGTQYAVALKKCYDRLNTAKTDGTGNERQQFCVFMSDGVPTTYQYSATEMHGSTSSTNQGYSDMKGMFTGTNYNTRSSSYVYEYYSTQMKANGVTVYTVGLGLEAKNNAWSSASATQCLNAASLLLNDIAGPAYETTLGTGSDLNKKDSYFYSVEDADAASQMTNVFQTIAQKILQAATDVTVEDKITKEYTMIFDIPTGSQEIEGLDSQEFYIEFLKYALDENHERTTSTSVTKLYLIDSNGDAAGGTYSAGSSATTAYAAPVFENKTIGDKGTLYYWTIDTAYASSAAVTYTVNGTTYYFIPYGIDAEDDDYDSTKWFNMTSGAYASGTIDSTTNMSENVVIATPYFVYNAATKKLYWTVDKIDTTEYALRYFLYLDDSATEIGTDKEVDADTYPTNEYAYLTYTNFNGKDVRQEFVKPQMTWNGAQVSYVFYLVNAQGQPINKSGQVVDFANAVFVTEIFTKSVVWNDTDTPETQEGVAYLDANWTAGELLPSGYTVFDPYAHYTLYVYEDNEGNTLDSYFKIEGSSGIASEKTTKVYITKADKTKYDTYGTYTEDDVYSTFDFANTTVAFAVVWLPALVEDTVVVDFGLDVVIDVTKNDLIDNNQISGIGKDQPAGAVINSGVYDASKLSSSSITLDDGNKVTLEGNKIRFQQGDMTFTAPSVFYYESKITYYQNGVKQPDGYLYTSVTVIPATTIYYEDSFISNDDLKSYEWDYATNDWKAPTIGIVDGNFNWQLEGTAVNGTQAEDRPGTTNIIGVVDANNNYGYDDAYSFMSLHSMGAALKVHVDYDHMATASFNFWGTGFDVISLTTNTTGTIIVNVYDSTDELYKSFTVNTYYGMKYEDGEWVTTTPDNPNALYQVPVMKIVDLPYGQYRAEIKVVYDPIFDQGLYEDASYDFYLDAIRIYDPTGNQNNDANNAYVADGEGWPAYTELRNMVLGADEVASIDGTVSGVVFIDGANPDLGKQADITDYTNYGPNNELYLANNQSIAFKLTATAITGTKIAGIQLGIKSVGGTGHIVIKDGDGNEYLDMDVATATEMYYDITALNGKNVIITSTGNAIISLTNVKVTYTGSQATSGTADPANETSNAVPASVMNAPTISVASTGAVYTATADEATAETETYLLSVNAETVACALRVLNAEEEEVEPDVPVEPEQPEEPVVPEEPEKPGKPGKPGKPQEPNKPIQPEKPGKPGNPVKPGRPVKPGNPGKPSNPSNPGKPGMPVLPGNPVKPGFSGVVVFY